MDEIHVFSLIWLGKFQTLYYYIKPLRIYFIIKRNNTNILSYNMFYFKNCLPKRNIIHKALIVKWKLGEPAYVTGTTLFEYLNMLWIWVGRNFLYVIALLGHSSNISIPKTCCYLILSWIFARNCFISLIFITLIIVHTKSRVSARSRDHPRITHNAECACRYLYILCFLTV